MKLSGHLSEKKGRRNNMSVKFEHEKCKLEHMLTLMIVFNYFFLPLLRFCNANVS